MIFWKIVTATMLGNMVWFLIANTILEIAKKLNRKAEELEREKFYSAPFQIKKSEQKEAASEDRG